MTRTENEKQVRLLSIFHYVYGGLSLLMTAILVSFFGLFNWMAFNPEKFSSKGKGPPDAFLWFMAITMGFWILWAVAKVVCTVLAGRFLATYRHRLFCIVIAALNCMSVPFGTVLGVFTILVLTRPSVRELFDQGVEAGRGTEQPLGEAR